MKSDARFMFQHFSLAFRTLLFMLLAVTAARAQTKPIDSLKEVIAARGPDDSIKVKLMNELAYRCYLVNIKDMGNYSERALAISKKIKYRLGEANAYHMQGVYYSFNDNDSLALNNFEMAISIFKSLKFIKGIYHTYNSMGYRFGDMQQDSTALVYFLKAKNAYVRSVEPRYELTILNNISYTYILLKRYKEAEDYSYKLLFMASKAKDYDQMARAYSNIATVNFAAGNSTIARNFADTGLALSRRHHSINLNTLSELNNIVGKVCVDLRSYDEAQMYFIRSLNLARKVNYSTMRSDNYLRLFKLDSNRGNFRQALYYLLESKKIDDSLLSNSTRHELLRYRIKYHTEKKSAENLLLRNQEETTNKIIRDQKTGLYYLVAGLVCIAVIVVYFFLANKEMSAKNNIINKQNANLEHINVVKDKLFSVVSHDLRGPLLQMKGLLNLFETQDVDDKELRELTPNVQKNLDKTLELVDNLLIWSKNQMQGFTLKQGQFDVFQMVNDNLQNFRNQAKQKDITIYNEIPAKLQVFADREMINIVLRNLISNAIKFTPEHGEIRILSVKNDEQIVIHVDDTGMGVKNEVLEKIFSFVNYSTPGTLNEKGSGVGLKLCKDFIELNKGKIWMNRKESGGSVFSFSLPVV